MGEGQGQSQFPSRISKGNPLKDSLEELLFNGYRVLICKMSKFWSPVLQQWEYI